MNEVLLDYVKTCKDAGIVDAQIRQQLITVGWAESEADMVLGAKPNIKEFAEKLTEQPVAKATETLKPKKKIFPTFNFKRKKTEEVTAPTAVKITQDTAKTEDKDPPQVVLGPDGHKYFVYFYPVPSHLQNDQSLKPTFIPMPPDGGTAMPASQYTKKKKSRFWEILDIVRRVTILTTLAVAIFFVANYFIQLKLKSNDFDKNIDIVTINNLESLRQKIEEFYQKNRKLPGTLDSVDSRGEFSKDSQTGQAYDYKIVSSSSFQICTVFNTDGPNYGRGYVCQPYEVNTVGMVAAMTAFNPENIAKNSTPTITVAKSFPGCANPVPLLTANAKCTDEHANCRKPQHNQDFGMSSVAISNVKDRIAQTFKLPTKEPATMVTEFSPFINNASGGRLCLAIYENEFDNEPLSGRMLAEYVVPAASLKANEFNHLYIRPISLQKGVSYSFVFSAMDADTTVTFARGMELSNYNEGNAYYLKRSLEQCSKNCEPEIWVDRQDDLQFNLKFY